MPTAPGLGLDTEVATVERLVRVLEEFVDSHFEAARVVEASSSERETSRLEKGIAALVRSGESHARSIAKAVSWRATGSLDTFLVALLITADTRLAAGVAAPEMPPQIALYYLHDRVWTLVPWGRRPTVD